MDQSQEAFETLNKNYSNQLNAVDNDQNISETEKSKQTIDILIKWKESLIKYNKSCMETIVNSTQILEIASEGSLEGPTTVRMSSMDCTQQIDSLKSAVKQMGLRSKQVLEEMKNFVATFEHQFQVNKKLSEENKLLKSELESANTKMLDLTEWSSKIEEENAELKRVVASKKNSDRTESDSFLVTLNLKNQEIRSLTRNLADVKKALHSQISVRSNPLKNNSNSPLTTTTPIEMGRLQSKNEIEELSRQLQNCTAESSRLEQENAELKRENGLISKDLSSKLETLQAESDAKDYQIGELNERLTMRTSTRISASELDSKPMGEAKMLAEINSLRLELETAKLELAEKNKLIHKLNHDLVQKTQQLASSTFVLERNAISRSQSKDDTDELYRRLEEFKDDLATKNLKINDLTQKLQQNAANQQPRSGSDELLRRLKDFTAELAAKDRKLSVLTQKLTSNSSPQDTSNIPTTRQERVEKRPNLYQIKQCESDDSNLTDAEALDAAKIRTLQKGYKTMASLIREKYDQLRKQRDEINDLRHLLDGKIRGSNANRMMKTVNLQCNTCDQLKEQLLENSTENKFQIEIYSHKLYLQEGQIASIMGDNQRLLEKHANLMKCIALCHQELSRCTSAN